MVSKRAEPEHASLFYQLILIGINALCLGIMLYLRMGSTIILQDDRPELVQQPPEEYVATGIVPVPVKAGLQIDQFRVFDVKEGSVTFSGTVWFELAQGAIPLETLGAFAIENGSLVERSDPHVRVAANGGQLVTYHVTVELMTLLNQKHFPLDAHRLFITLVHRAPQVVLQSTERDFVLDASLDTFGWRQGRQLVTSGYRWVQLDAVDDHKSSYYSVALFSVDIERAGKQYLFLAIIPLLLVFYVTLLALSIGKDNVAPMASILVAIPGYRIVMQTITPQIGYLVLSDYFYFLFLALTCFAFLTNLVLTFALRVNIMVRRVIFALIHVVMVCSSAWILWML